MSGRAQTTTPQQSLILSKYYTVAKMALDEAIKKNDKQTIRTGLLQSISFELKGDIAEAIAEEKMIDLLPDLLTALEYNAGCISGGSESEAAQKQLNERIVEAISKLTALGFPYFDASKIPSCSNDSPSWEIKRIIAEANDWIRTNSNLN